ncbi:MAG: MiaB/RimO family radical SAM methylthiotransferase [Oscillospiraceae bacterium]|nr:MiaB/RimO family radical SAM methylthiotransferase [Oscillospiraceae bacterium]
MIFSCLTLGCKTNQTETDSLAETLMSHGHEYSPYGGAVNAVIINTCSVTSVSDKKSRAAISRARRDNPGAVIAVHGCMAQAMTEKPPNVDVLGGTGDRSGFIEALERVTATRGARLIIKNGVPGSSRSTVGAVIGRTLQYINSQRFADAQSAPLQKQKTRAFLKVQDGCSNSCSYCIIPSLRGESRSVPLADVVQNAKRFADSGAKEIVLTGIEISAYDGGIAHLAATLAEEFQSIRFRLGSLDSSCVTSEFARILSARKNICPHFHLAVQSGCGKTLAAMNRQTEKAAQAVKLLRSAFDCTLGCDIIVGFPGESEADFLESLDFIENHKFTFTHIFPYSDRPGTAAASMPNKLTNAEKRARARRASELSDRLFAESAAKQIFLDVLFETEKDGESIGHAENYFEVCVKAENLRNEIRRVKILGIRGKTLIGEL